MTMWKKIAPLLVILSISLNIAFLGGWIVQAAKKQPANPGPCSQACEGSSCPLHRDLNITKHQWKQMEPRLAQFRSESEALCRDIQRLRGELIDLIASPEPDSTAIALKQDQILAGQRKMQEQVINHLLAEKQMLTEEQQARLWDKIREKTGCTSRNSVVCPVSIPGMPSPIQSNDITEQ